MQPDGIWHSCDEPPTEPDRLWTFSHPGESGYADVGVMAHLREIDWPSEKWKLSGVWTVKGEGQPQEFQLEAPKPGERVEFR